jgi:hypothetical protein
MGAELGIDVQWSKATITCFTSAKLGYVDIASYPTKTAAWQAAACSVAAAIGEAM